MSADKATDGGRSPSDEVVGRILDAVNTHRTRREDVEALARVIDPEAFEDHAIEARQPLAAIQWAARRQIAAEHAERVAAHLAAPAGEELVSALTRDLLSDPWFLRNPDEAEAAARYFIATGWTKSEVAR